jgi:RNA polymerase sigma factor (sigma-70 family)
MRDQFTEIADDGQLLARVTGHNGDEAFAALVLRHRDFVHRVCRRVLGNAEDAEDATQQVFIVLAERAGMLSGRTSIAGWLYRTAWQVSLRTRRGALTRQNHERSAARREGYIPPLVAQEADSLARLHEVVGQLPEAYQEAVVLHYFGGYTVAEAAARLKCPPGTVASRISRGLQLIRAKLGDRGLVITAAALKALLLAEAFHARAAMAGGVPLARAAALRFAPRWRVPGRVFRTGAIGGSTLLGISIFGTRLSGGSVIGAAGVPALKPLLPWFLPRFSLNIFAGLPTGVKAAAGVAIASLLGTTCFATVIAIAAANSTTVTAQKSQSDSDQSQAPTKKVSRPVDPSADKAASYVSAGPTTGVPEPSSLTVLLIGGVASLSRRRITRHPARM